MTEPTSVRRWTAAAAVAGLLAAIVLASPCVVGASAAQLGTAQRGEESAGVGDEQLALESGGAPAEPAGSASHEPDPLFDDDWDIDDTLGFPDPLEPMNRVFLGFNRGLDKVLFDPLTQLYRFAFPRQVRLAIRRVFLNVGSPPIIVNDVLQGEFEDAGVALGRLSINTLLGGGGVIDVAADSGLERHRADFGQTMALYGVKSGPYLVLPVFGPGNIRDTTGGLIDGFMRPATWILGFTEQIYYGGGSGLSTREENYEALQALVDSSVDFYAALRNAYYQSRKGEVWERRQAPIIVLIPDVADERRRSSDLRNCRWIMRRGPRIGLESCSRGSRAPGRTRFARTR